VESEGDVHILHICPVELCDNGDVTCTARSGMSGDEECVARTELTVRDGDDALWSLQAEDGGPEAPAMLIRGPSDTTALRGERVVLKATYVGVPHPLVRWLKAVSCLMGSEEPVAPQICIQEAPSSNLVHLTSHSGRQFRWASQFLEMIAGKVP